MMILNWCYVKTGIAETPLILFLVVLFTLVFFLGLVLALTTRLSNTPTGILLKRKREVFPFRVYHLTFNALMFCSCS